MILPGDWPPAAVVIDLDGRVDAMLGHEVPPETAVVVDRHGFPQDVYRRVEFARACGTGAAMVSALGVMTNVMIEPGVADQLSGCGPTRLFRERWRTTDNSDPQLYLDLG